MQMLYLPCIFAQLILTELTMAGEDDPPSWAQPVESLTKTSSQCIEITQLHAISGDGSELNISIVSQNPDGGFAIGENVFMYKILTCNQATITTSLYEVVVRVQHINGNANHADKNITITFSDKATSEPPEFTTPDPDDTKEEHKIYMNETDQAGHTVLTLTATDADTDVGLLTFNMDASLPATKALFKIDSRELKVQDNVDADFFDADKDGAVLEYPVILEANDGDLSTTLSTTINIRDVNDNSPKFSGDTEADIPESTPAGHTVFIVAATDHDKTEENNQVTLSLNIISGGSEFELVGNEIKVANGVTFNVDTQSSYALTVTAVDSSPTNPLQTEANFTVSIKAAPVFVDPDPDENEEAHKIHICETIQAGDDVMQLLASDKDTDTASLTFNMDQSIPATKALFRIDGDMLKVQDNVSATVFDFDKENAITEYPIVLEVSDGDQSATVTTTINVEDDNDNAPVYFGDAIASILETSPAGTFVLKLTATDNDKTEEYRNITFSLPGTSAFEIGGDNSDDILVAAGTSFNFDVQPSYTLAVTASDNAPVEAQTTDRNITINITTEPVFNKLNITQTTTVDENAADTVAIYELDVTDKDGTGLLNISFAEPVPDMFRLDGQILRPKTGANLDAEGDITSYQLKFKASDGTNDVESAVLNVTVNDVNDNPPVFTDPDPIVEISEKAEGGSSVYEVKATDADVGNPNNVMIFSMAETGTSHFSIGENTGIISVKTGATLDFSSKSEYQLVVTANDGVFPTDNAANTTVTVKLKTAPTFINPKDGDSIPIPEITASGSVVKALTRSDQDEDPPTFTLLSQDPASPEKFNIQESNIITTDTFDVDAAGAVTSYVLEISVSDGRSYTNNETIKVTINIVDSNDKAPEFEPGAYTADVKETETIGATVFSVTAVDKDLTDANNQIKYSLSGTADFSINQDSGDIIVDADLSYGTTQEYDITVTATDSGTPANTVNQIVKFTILAEPKFANLAVARSKDIDENLHADSSVFSIAVTDSDSTWDNVVSIVSQTPAEMFKLEGTVLKTKTNGLDAETETIYKLKFSLTDGPFVVESAELTINISDLNDNPPKISTVTPVAVPENKIIGTVVVDIEATDGDVTAANNVLSYSIVAGNDDGMFAIDTANGSITLNKTLSLETYTLEVKVSDSGSSILTASTNVSIYVDATASKNVGIYVEANVIDECLPNQCQNGATCSSSVNVYMCQCVPGYIGTNCETNRNECEPNPCMNGGTCTDGINFFSCSCTEGWKGTNCTDVCTSSTYGRNCAERCNCNASRLILNVGNQQCDIRTGVCKCNSNWAPVDKACTDRNECADSSICSGAHVVCENTIGGYYCTCEQGYENTTSGCEKVTPPKVEVAEGEVRVQTIMSLNIDGCPDLTIPSFYLIEETKITNMLQVNLPSEKLVYVISIWCNSLDFEAIIVIDKADAAKLASEIANISDAVEYDGQTVTVNSLEVNGSSGEAQVNIFMSINTDCPNLSLPSVYAIEKKKIENSLKVSLSSIKDVHVTEIWCRLLNFESIIFIDKADAATLANEIASISGAVEYDGSPVTVNNLEVNGFAVNKYVTVAQQVCDAYTAIEPCAEEHECKYENGLPSCQKMEKDSTSLILGLGLGVGLTLLVVAIIAGAFYLYKQLCKAKRQARLEMPEGRKSHPEYKRRLRKKESPWHGRTEQNEFEMDTRHYDQPHFYEDLNHYDTLHDRKHNYDMLGLDNTTR